MTKMLATLAATLTALSFLAQIPAQAADADNWKTLFNGKELDGWKVIDGPADSWKVVDGVIVSTPSHGWLSTDDEYENFELELEYNVAKGGNSGVFLRTPHTKGNPSELGMEIQILDDEDPQYAKIEEWQHCGSLYGVAPAKAKAQKKAGEWQTYKIVCDGRHVKITLNGVDTVDTNLDDHKDVIEKHPGITQTKGYIGLQNHGSHVQFRNIRVRKLP